MNDDGLPYCEIQMPKDSNVAHVGMSGGDIAVWAFVETDEPLETETFFIVPTGVEVPAPNDAFYLGTVHQNVFVWHIFQKIK